MTFRFSYTLKITAFLTLLVFSAQSLLQAVPASLDLSVKSKEVVSAPPFLKSPKSYFSVDRGQVQEQFLSQSTPFIYLVEDAHDSLDAQESIRQILKQLVEKEKVSLVCFEGGSEKLDRSFYDFTHNSSKNKKIWDELFKQGQIGGLERYALEASPKVKFSGLENKKVYFENVHSVQRIFREKEKLQGVLKQIDSVFEELSGKLVTGDAKKIRDLRKSFNDGRLNFLQYAKKIISLSFPRRRESSMDQTKWPQMARLIKLQEFELKLKQQEVGIQKELAQVRKKTSSDLRFIWFPEQHEKVKGHLRWYFEKAVDQGLNFKKYPNLSNWVGFHVLQDEISAANLFEELDRLGADVLSKLEMPEETRTFLKLDNDYIRVKKLISLEVSRKEWNQLKSDNLNLKPLAKQLCALYKKTFHRKPKIKVWDALRLISLFKSAKANYELVEMRDVILSKRIREQIARANVKKAAVVTGGFHTDMIAAFLKGQQIGYAVISPVISDVNNKLNYRALIDPELSQTRQPAVAAFGADSEIIPFQNLIREKALAIGNSLGFRTERDRTGFGLFSGTLKPEEAECKDQLQDIFSRHFSVEEADRFSSTLVRMKEKSFERLVQYGYLNEEEMALAYDRKQFDVNRIVKKIQEDRQLYEEAKFSKIRIRILLFQKLIPFQYVRDLRESEGLSKREATAILIAQNDPKEWWVKARRIRDELIKEEKLSKRDAMQIVIGHPKDPKGWWSQAKLVRDELMKSESLSKTNATEIVNKHSDPKGWWEQAKLVRTELMEVEGLSKSDATRIVLLQSHVKVWWNNAKAVVTELIEKEGLSRHDAMQIVIGWKDAKGWWEKIKIIRDELVRDGNLSESEAAQIAIMHADTKNWWGKARAVRDELMEGESLSKSNATKIVIRQVDPKGWWTAAKPVVMSLLTLDYNQSEAVQFVIRHSIDSLKNMLETEFPEKKVEIQKILEPLVRYEKTKQVPVIAVLEAQEMGRLKKVKGQSLGSDFATLKAPTADPLQNRINSDFVFIESVIKKAKEVEIPENLLSELRSPKHGKIFERLIQAIRLRKSPRIRFYVSDHPAAANLFGIPRYNGAILARDTIPAYSNRDNRGDLRIYVTRHFYQLMLKDNSLYAFVLDHEFYEKFTVPNKSHEQAWRDRGWLDYFVDSNTKLNKYLKIFIDRMADEGDVEGLDRFKSSSTEKGRLSYEYAQMKKRDVLSRSQLFLTIKPEVDDKEVDAWRVNKAIANRGINLEIQYAKFENEERYAYVPDPEYVKGKDCTLFFNKPDSNRELIKLLFAVELLEDCGAKSITLILPANVPAWIQDSLRAFATIQLVNTKQAKNRKKHDHLPAHGDPILKDKKKIRPPAVKEFDRILIMPNADKYEWRGMHNLAYLEMNEANGRMQIPQGLKSGGHYLLIAMTDRHNEVLRLLETLSALARKGIHPVVFVPYFSYGRQHMAYPMPKHGPKAISSNSARAILKAISQFSSRVYGVNMHFTKHPGEMEVEKEFPGLGSYIQIHNVNLFPQLVQYFQKNEDLIRPLIVGADKGAHDFALEASRISGIEYGKHMDKVRDGSKPTQMQVDMKMPDTDVSGRDVILLDDIIASGTTIINAALLLKSRGANRIFVGTVYGEFTKGIEIFGNQDVIKKQIEKLKASGQFTDAQSETLNASLSKAPLIDGLKATDIMLALNPENVVSLTSILDLNKLMMNSPARRSIYGASLGVSVTQMRRDVIQYFEAQEDRIWKDRAMALVKEERDPGTAASIVKYRFMPPAKNRKTFAELALMLNKDAKQLRLMEEIILLIVWRKIKREEIEIFKSEGKQKEILERPLAHLNLPGGSEGRLERVAFGRFGSKNTTIGDVLRILIERRARFKTADAVPPSDEEQALEDLGFPVEAAFQKIPKPEAREMMKRLRGISEKYDGLVSLVERGQETKFFARPVSDLDLSANAAAWLKKAAKLFYKQDQEMNIEQLLGLSINEFLKMTAPKKGKEIYLAELEYKLYQVGYRLGQMHADRIRKQPRFTMDIGKVIKLSDLKKKEGVEAVLKQPITALDLPETALMILRTFTKINFGIEKPVIGDLKRFNPDQTVGLKTAMQEQNFKSLNSQLKNLADFSLGNSLGQADIVSVNAVIIVRDACGGIVGLFLKDVAPEIYQSLIPRFASDKPAGKSLVITGPVSPIALIDQIKGHKTVIVYYEDDAYKKEFERIAEKMKAKGEVLQEELNRYGYFAYLPKLHLTRAEFVRQVLKNVKVDYDGVGPRSIGRIASQSGIRNYVSRLVWQGDEDLIHQVIAKMPVVLGRPLRVSHETNSGNADTDLVVLKLASLLSENPEALEKKGLLVLENGIYIPTDLFYSFLDKAIAEHNFEKLTATMA